MSDREIPYSVEHVTSQWLTDALASTVVIKSSTITSFDSEPLGVGQGSAGQITRLKLTYDTREDGAPHSLIAKFPSINPSWRATLNEFGPYAR